MTHMRLGFSYRIFAVLAAVCIALASVASANRMALPADHDPALVAYVQAGGSLHDLCLPDEGTGHSDHDCPFCRLLADPDDLTPAQVTWMLVPAPLQDRLVALPYPELPQWSRDPARAPPVTRI